MYNLVNNYPTTNFHEINLDYIIKLVRENNGLHLDVSGNQLLLKTLDGTTVSSVTVHYAETAGHADTATNATNATYATTASTASSATNATNAGHALTADTATTAGTAQTATTATTAGTATEAVHATTADTALTANTATTATRATYAETTGNVEHADKAIESVVLDGNNIKFTTYDGTSSTITVPYSVKASRDSSANYINQTYVADVVDNEGTLEFKNAQGNTIVSLVPSVQSASNDSYGNLIADMVKTIAVSSNSNYVTVTHGTGTTDTITINYSEKAYKDTNDNVIKNTYIKSLAMVKDDDTGHYNLVAYNGDNPTAEIFRIELIAYRAQIADDATHASNADYATNAGHATTADAATTADTATTADKASNGDVITEYVKSFERSSTAGNQNLIIKDGDGNTVQTINLFNASNMYIKFKDQDPLTPLYPLDATFTVSHSEEYEIENLSYWGWDDFRLHYNNVGIQYRYADENGDVKMQSPGAYYTKDGYLIQLYDSIADAIKVFKIEGGNSANTMMLTRLK